MSHEMTVTISAVADNSQPSGYRFSMLYNSNAVSELEFSKDKDKLKKSQYYTVTFVLDPTNNGGLRFSHARDTVFWAKEIPNKTAPCVNSASHLPGIFVDPATPIQDREIKVINVDRQPQLFTFAFNFLRPGDSDGPNTNYALFDPIGSNQNGGTTVKNASALLVGGSGLLVGALVGAYLIAPALS